MAVGAFVPVALWNHSAPFVRAYLVGAAVMVAFGIVDDMRNLEPKWKLLGQLAAALIVVLFGGLKVHNLGGLLKENTVLPEWICLPLTILVIVGVTNAVNLADVLDGLAGGICLLIFACIGYLAWLERTSLSGSSPWRLPAHLRIPSVQHHTRPMVFMGDTGSPASRVLRGDAVAGPHTGRYPFKPADSPDPAGPAGPRHAVGDGDPYRERGGRRSPRT